MSEVSDVTLLGHYGSEKVHKKDREVKGTTRRIFKEQKILCWIGSAFNFIFEKNCSQ